MRGGIVVTIEARMGSTRLPGKTLMKLGENTVLEYMVKRLRRLKKADDIILATTVNTKDDPIEEIAGKIGLRCYRGSEDNVLARVYEAACSVNAGVIIETTADCPMVDAELIDRTLRIYLENKYDCVGSGMIPSYPHGLDFYIIGFELLKLAHEQADTPFQREHTIEFITAQPERFRNYYIEAPEELRRPDVRITVDYKEDLERMNLMIKRLGPENYDYDIQDIIRTWDELFNDEKKS